jgi:hypothetical protein
MTSRIVSKLALAAVLASSVPAIAAAHDDGRPVVAERREELATRRWREERRDRELAAARADLRRLEAERAEYLRHPHRRGELRRYESRYSERRAALERRCHELDRVAWR